MKSLHYQALGSPLYRTPRNLTAPRQDSNSHFVTCTLEDVQKIFLSQTLEPWTNTWLSLQFYWWVSTKSLKLHCSASSHVIEFIFPADIAFSFYTNSICPVSKFNVSHCSIVPSFRYRKLQNSASFFRSLLVCIYCVHGSEF